MEIARWRLIFDEKFCLGQKGQEPLMSCAVRIWMNCEKFRLCLAHFVISSLSDFFSLDDLHVHSGVFYLFLWNLVNVY